MKFKKTASRLNLEVLKDPTGDFTLRLFSALLKNRKKLSFLNFCEDQDTCVGNLGLLRKEMPVIEKKNLVEFVLLLKKGFLNLRNPVKIQDDGKDFSKGISRRYPGVKITPVEILAGDLKATQKEIDREKAEGMLNKYLKGDFDLSKERVLMSSDNYILDGHHRWAALLILSKERGVDLPMKGFQIDLPIKKLLPIANAYTDFRKVKRKDI